MRCSKSADAYYDLLELSGYLTGMMYNCCYEYRDCHKRLAYKDNKCAYDFVDDKLESIMDKVCEM